MTKSTKSRKLRSLLEKPVGEENSKRLWTALRRRERDPLKWPELFEGGWFPTCDAPDLARLGYRLDDDGVWTLAGPGDLLQGGRTKLQLRLLEKATPRITEAEWKRLWAECGLKSTNDGLVVYESVFALLCAHRFFRAQN